MKKTTTKRNSPEAVAKRQIKGIRHGRHCVFALHAHLVFVTKYRKFCFSGRVLDVIKSSIEEVCEKFKAELVEFEGEGDHVHVLVNYPPTVEISKLVNSLKGVSSRRVREKNFPEVTEKLWGGALWSPSYFASSCGGASLETIKEYIENQERPE